MATHPVQQPTVHQIHVEGRAPLGPGKAQMVAVSNGIATNVNYVGSHHEAVYFAAITEMADALRCGHAHISITSPSEHLVEQMNGRWKVGDELRPFHDLAVLLKKRFASVSWTVAPRTP